MSADPYYIVQADGSAYGPHDADCFKHAEQRARWYAARSPHRYVIERVTPRKPTKQGNSRQHREIVATVIRDALGRVWTDVQTMDGLI